MSVTDRSALRARFFGTFGLEIDGNPVNRWRAGKARALFQYLLVNRGQVVQRDRLQDILWPDGECRSTSSLKVAAHAVRRVLDTQRDPAGQLQLIHRDGGYLLLTGNAWLDTEEFQRACEQGRVASLAKDHTRAVEHFRHAMGLYLGDFLAGETDEWIVEQRTWIRGLVLAALTELRTDAVVREEWPEVVHWCRRTLELEPCHEETYQTLMMMHGELGEPGRVRDWYELYRRRLRQNLDLEPGERTERILLSALNGGRGTSRAARGPAARREQTPRDGRQAPGGYR